MVGGYANHCIVETFIRGHVWTMDDRVKCQKVFRAAVAKALLTRDGVEPTPQVVAKFTLYSNKVGKKVHMDFVPKIDGTLTRQLGGWAPAAGDAPYSRIHPTAIGNAHAATNSVQISVIE